MGIGDIIRAAAFSLSMMAVPISVRAEESRLEFVDKNVPSSIDKVVYKKSSPEKYFYSLGPRVGFTFIEPNQVLDLLARQGGEDYGRIAADVQVENTLAMSLGISCSKHNAWKALIDDLIFDQEYGVSLDITSTELSGNLQESGSTLLRKLMIHYTISGNSTIYNPSFFFRQNIVNKLDKNFQIGGFISLRLGVPIINTSLDMEAWLTSSRKGDAMAKGNISGISPGLMASIAAGPVLGKPDLFSCYLPVGVQTLYFNLELNGNIKAPLIHLNDVLNVNGEYNGTSFVAGAECLFQFGP